MIPREILKKIRPSERCTHREVGRVTPCAPAVRHGHAPAGKGLPALPEAGRPTHPVAGISQVAASVSPSPWEEGRDEGGQNCLYLTIGRVNSVSCCNITACNRATEALAGRVDNIYRNADSSNGVADDRDSLADDRNNAADGADQLADDRDTVADGCDAFADGRDTFASERNRRAGDHDKRAASGDRLAGDTDKVAGGRDQRADAPAFFVANRKCSRRRQIHFSTP